MLSILKLSNEIVLLILLEIFKFELIQCYGKLFDSLLLPITRLLLSLELIRHSLTGKPSKDVSYHFKDHEFYG